MASSTGERMRVVVYYALWATMCAAVAGLSVAAIHTAFFSGAAGWSALGRTFLGGAGTAVALAAGQGVVAFVTGSGVASLGRTLRFTVLLGLLIGLFDLAMYLVQMLVPATELGWGPDLVILGAVVVGVTTLGSTSNRRV